MSPRDLDVISPFSQEYLNVMINYLMDISREINKGGNHYKKHLEILLNLVRDGKTDKTAVDVINKYLVKAIESVSSDNSNMVIYVKTAPEDLDSLINELKTKIENFKASGADSRGRDFLRFRADFKQSIEQGIKDLFFSKSPVVRIFCDKVESSPQIIEEYIKNYMGLNKPVADEISFSEEAVIKYYQYIEYRIVSKISGEEEALNDNIEAVVNSFVKNLLAKVDNLELESYDKRIVDLIAIEFAWMKDQNDPMIADRLEDFKQKIRRKILNMAEQANDEIFPKLLESKILESKQKYSNTVVKIAQLISDLEDQRDALVKELKSEGLSEYADYVSLDFVSNYEESLDKLQEISEESPAVLLKSFIRKRQEKGKLIRSQLDQDSNNSYFKIKKDIEALESTPQEGMDTIINYFISSVKAFASQLENSILGDLDQSFVEIEERITPRSLQCGRAIKEVRDKELLLEDSEKQDRINSLLGSMTQYKLPSTVVDQIMGSFALSSEEEISQFLKHYTEESFCAKVASILDEKELDDLFALNIQGVQFAEIAAKITKTRVIAAGNYVKAFKDVVKDVISNESIVGSVIKTGANVVAPGLGMGFGLLMGILDARKDNKEQEQLLVEGVRSLLSSSIESIGSMMVKDKFDMELKDLHKN